MFTNRNTSARRREVRRSVGPGRRWRAWLIRRDMVWAGLFVAALTLMGGTLVITAQSRPMYAVNQFIPRAMVPRVDFRAVDKPATLAHRKDASQREPAVYDLSAPAFQDLRDKFTELQRLALDPGVMTQDQVPASDRAWLINHDVLMELRRLNTKETDWQARVDRFLAAMARVPLLPADRVTLEQDRNSRAMNVCLRQPEKHLEASYDRDMLLSTADNPADREKLRQAVAPLAIDAFPQVYKTVVALVAQGPREFYQYNKPLTEQRRQAAYDREPAVENAYTTDGVMVHAGARLDQQQIDLIHKEDAEYGRSLHGLAAWLPALGSMGMVGLIAMGLWAYILAYNWRIARNPTRGVALTALLLLCQSAAIVGTGLLPQYPIVGAAFPTLLAVAVLAMAYDQRFAMAVGAFLTLLVGLSLGQSVGFTVVLLAGVGACVLQLDDVRTRSKLVIVGFWSGVTMALAGAAVAVAQGVLIDPLIHVEMTQLLDGALITFATGCIAGLFVQGVLPAIERTFKITTSMTLKELNDASHPLLQKLAQEAPGTYQHSLRIGDMAESAAEAIGANGLLCRVGAMYHDIGKINKPDYFVENQAGGPNRHSKLSPAMSLLIIVGHVKDGIEMAREYGLPPVIRQFIESHHGTTLVEYFYHAARQQRNAQGGPAPTEFEYRYPGPKPQSREAAILMICDGVEGASRTLVDPTPVRLEQLVHAMAGKRLQDGQFDECNLTLHELHRIEQAITKTLCAIHHSRIKYPGADLNDLVEPTPSAAS